MLAVHTKGAPESALPSCAAAMDVDGGESRLDDALRATVQQVLVRAWLLLGSVSAVLVMGGFFLTLLRAGGHPGDATGPGTVLHHTYLQAATMTLAGIVACQVGTAFAARTDRASLFTVGLWSNPILLCGIAFELAFTAVVSYPRSSKTCSERRVGGRADRSPAPVPGARVGSGRAGAVATAAATATATATRLTAPGPACQRRWDGTFVSGQVGSALEPSAAPSRPGQGSPP